MTYFILYFKDHLPCMNTRISSYVSEGVRDSLESGENEEVEAETENSEILQVKKTHNDNLMTIFPRMWSL